MSYIRPKFPSPMFYWGYIAAGIQSILGGYKKGAFDLKDLSQDDLTTLNKGKEFIDSSLEGIAIIEDTSLLFKNKSMHSPLETAGIALETLLAIYPHSKLPGTSSKIKRELIDYKEILQKIMGRKFPEDKTKLEQTYLFFSNISEKADVESAKYMH